VTTHTKQGKSVWPDDAKPMLVCALRTDETATDPGPGYRKGHSPRESVDALLAAGCDERLLDAHLMQIESAMKNSGDTSEQLRTAPSRARSLASCLRMQATKIEAIRVGLFDPITFVRVCSSHDPGLLQVQMLAVREFVDLPKAMNRYAALLDRQVKQIGRWRLGWLRGNFALTESVRLLVNYVGSDFDMCRLTSTHSRSKVLKRWVHLSCILNALARKNSVGISFTPKQLMRLYQR
jgi:hypothetical protein